MGSNIASCCCRSTPNIEQEMETNMPDKTRNAGADPHTTDTALPAQPDTNGNCAGQPTKEQADPSRNSTETQVDVESVQETIDHPNTEPQHSPSPCAVDGDLKFEIQQEPQSDPDEPLTNTTKHAELPSIIAASDDEDEQDLALPSRLTAQRSVTVTDLVIVHAQAHSANNLMPDGPEPANLSQMHRSVSYGSILLTPIAGDIPARTVSNMSDLNLDRDFSRSGTRFVLPYKCEEDMYDSEKIDFLIKMELPDVVWDTLGDAVEYTLPSKQHERLYIERDLRKIKVALLEYRLEEAMQRKYAKLCVLKHHDLLNSIYKRYCKIGRDTQWMTIFAWISLWRDCGMVTSQSDEHRFIDIFHKVYQYHHEHFHSARKHLHHSRHSISQSAMYGTEHLHDKDPWTGVWLLQKHRNRVSVQQTPVMRPKAGPSTDLDDEEISIPSSAARPSMRMALQNTHSYKPSAIAFNLSTEKYKFRKIGDRKIIGFIRDSRRFLIGGWLNRSDFKKATLKAETMRNNKDKWVYQCQLIAPKSLSEPLGMKIKWEHTKIGAAASRSGVTKLFKLDTLEENDIDLPVANYVGLSRHEFLDALLCVARLSDDERPLYSLFDELITKSLDLFVYRNMTDLKRFLKGNHIEHEVHDRLHSDSSVVRLFGKYASLEKDSENMEEDEWCALAEDLYSIANDMTHDIWKHGGKLSMDQLIQCFTLSKPAQSMDEQWINLGEFIRCLLYFVAALFRNQPDVEYEVLPFEDKLDLVLKWCHKLDAQNKDTTAELFHSTSLHKVKQRRSIPTMSPSTNSVDYGCTDGVTIPAITPNSN